MKLKYLAIFMCIASLFTSCCKEDEEDEVEESEPQSIERPDSEASPKPEIPQPTISLNGTWNEDHPRYVIQTTNLDIVNIKTVYLKEVFTDKHTIPETVKDRIIKFDSKDKIVLDKRHWPSQGEEVFKAVAYIETDTAIIKTDTITLVHPSEWITTRRILNVPSGLCESSIFAFENAINQYSCETGELLKSYPWKENGVAHATFFTKEYMYYILEDETNNKKNHVYRLNLKTSKIEHLAYYIGTINRIWVDQSKIYICDLNTQMREINVKENKAELVEGVDGFNYFSIDGNYIYGSVGTTLYRYKSGNPSSIKNIGNLPSTSWQRISVQDGWLYFVDNNILCKTKMSTLNNTNREIIKLGRPFEPSFEYGNSLQTYTDGKYYYVRMKFKGMLVTKKRLVNYKP